MLELILDIITLIFAKLVGDKGKVIAFEPETKKFCDYLKKILQ